MTLRLAEVTPANFDAAIDLKVHPAQEHPGIAWPRLIFDGDRLVARWR
ncbi:hypothetical protein [Amycolatopsis sp. EV170708-02-1]|nr:hypothetical protein [Amycolatopsis sp. EV170708-02-1]UMP06573.1 hypothetical protein MJQ72_17950 [Amycolatopsis sp. EV170708-02-1]